MNSGEGGVRVSGVNKDLYGKDRLVVQRFVDIIHLQGVAKLRRDRILTTKFRSFLRSKRYLERSDDPQMAPHTHTGQRLSPYKNSKSQSRA